MSLIPEQQSTSLRFHFNCFALCEITPPDPEYPIDGDNKAEAELIGGFYASREAAERAIDKTEIDRRGNHRSEMAAYRKQFGFDHYDPEYKPGHYEIVPLAAVRFLSLEQLEDSITTAACLQFAGIGKEVVNA